MLKDSSVFASMQEGPPYKSYIKTVTAKVYVTVLNPFNHEPEGRVLVGRPNKKEEGCIVDVWSDKEDMFFKRMNKKHFDDGNLVTYQRDNPTTELATKEITDEFLLSLLDAKKHKFISFQHELNKFTTLAPLFRLKDLAVETEKSEKIIKSIEAKISELDQKEYAPLSEE